MSQISYNPDPHGIYLRLSAQSALLGNVPATLRAVSVERDNTRIRCRFVFDGEPSDNERDDAVDVSAHIMGDYPSPFTVDEEFVELPAPSRIEHLQHLVFLRAEPSLGVD